MLFEKKNHEFEPKTVLLEIQVDQIVIDQLELPLNQFISRGEIDEELTFPISQTKLSFKIAIGDNVPVNNDLVKNLELQN